jgi:hypothetical protein
VLARRACLGLREPRPHTPARQHPVDDGGWGSIPCCTDKIAAVHSFILPVVDLPTTFVTNIKASQLKTYKNHGVDGKNQGDRDRNGSNPEKQGAFLRGGPTMVEHMKLSPVLPTGYELSPWYIES